MERHGREPASELDLTRMIARPAAPSSGVWRPLAGVLIAAIVALSATLILRTDAATGVEEISAVDDETLREVSRAETSLLDVTAALPSRAGPPVSQQVRRPIRITDRSAEAHDLRKLTATALDTFNHRVTQDDLLQRILIRTLAEGQSDAYIDAALNAALARGEFAAPAALTTPFGELDTNRLLQAVLAAAQG